MRLEAPLSRFLLIRKNLHTRLDKSHISFTTCLCSMCYLSFQLGLQSLEKLEHGDGNWGSYPCGCSSRTSRSCLCTCSHSETRHEHRLSPYTQSEKLPNNNLNQTIHLMLLHNWLNLLIQNNVFVLLLSSLLGLVYIHLLMFLNIHFPYMDLLHLLYLALLLYLPYLLLHLLLNLFHFYNNLDNNYYLRYMSSLFHTVLHPYNYSLL